MSRYNKNDECVILPVQELIEKHVKEIFIELAKLDRVERTTRDNGQVCYYPLNKDEEFIEPFLEYVNKVFRKYFRRTHYYQRYYRPQKMLSKPWKETPRTRDVAR